MNGAQTHLSPNFEARFSRIDIDHPLNPHHHHHHPSTPPPPNEGQPHLQLATTNSGSSALRSSKHHSSSTEIPSQSINSSTKLPTSSPSLSLDPPPPSASTTPNSLKPRKKYPPNLVPTTPAQGPLLSTARRAESRLKNHHPRNLASPRNPAIPSVPPPVPKIQTRQPLLLYVPPEAPKKPPTRSTSLPHTLQVNMINDYAYSFMKGTSSSSKKRIPPLREANSPTPDTVIPTAMTKSTRKVSRTQLPIRNPLNHTNSANRPVAATDKLNGPTNITTTTSTTTTPVPSSLRRHQVKRSLSRTRRVTSLNHTGAQLVSSGVSPSSSKSSEFDFKYEGRRNFSLPSHGVDVYSRLYNESKKPSVLFKSGLVKSQLSRTLSLALKPPPISVRADICESTPKQKYPDQKPQVSNSRELMDLIAKSNPNLIQELKEENLLDNYIESKPMSSEKLASYFSNEYALSVYERGELLRRKDVYYPGQSDESEKRNALQARNINVKNFGENYGFDDNEGNYVIFFHDHINFRYEIDSVLGKGSFGNVVKCKDHKNVNTRTGKSRTAAVKIIKSDLNWSLQAVTEIKMLKHLNDSYGKNRDKNDLPVLEYYEHFHFRSHMCIATEVLSLNLFTMIEVCDYRGFSYDLLKDFCKQTLKGLEFIHNLNVLHCDVKPENIMIKLTPLGEEWHMQIKIIDFGSSCFKNEVTFSYIQSRFYRAPEVIIGAKYDEKIDVWSFGCVAAELFTGMPLLPGKNELEQVGLMLELFGCPSAQYIQNSRKKMMKTVELQKQRLIDGDRSKATDLGGNNFLTFTNGNVPTVTEKSLKKTLLFTLFDLDGKINLQFLNMRLQSLRSQSSTYKKSVKVSSKILEIALKLGKSENKRDPANFSRFLHSIFQWDPQQRPSCSELLMDPFLDS